MVCFGSAISHRCTSMAARLGVLRDRRKKGENPMREVKRLVFRIRKKYFDAIVSGEKMTEFRPDSPFWRSRIDNKGKPNEPAWIAVFICGKRVHRREITLIQKVETPTGFSEQGKEDVSTPQCYAVHLGKEVKWE